MYDLISKKSLLSAYDEKHKGPAGGARKLIEDAPSIPAVPLDKLCEWLEENALDITQRNTTPLKTSAGHWKRVMKKWVEGLEHG